MFNIRLKTESAEITFKDITEKESISFTDNRRFNYYIWNNSVIRTNEELVALKTVNPETGQQQYYRDNNNYERPGDLYIMDLDGDGQITADGDRTEIPHHG